MNNKNYNLKKIKNLPSFKDDLKEKLKNPEFKEGFVLASKRLDLASEIIEARKKAKLSQV